jgi:hypothetical protein
MAIPTLTPVKKFRNKHDGFTEGGLRHEIFHAKENGLEKTCAIVRNGRKILINEERYFLLIEIKNTGEYEQVIKLIDDAEASGKYLPLEDAVGQIRAGVRA